MSITTSEYEELLEGYIKSESLQEKIKFYLEVYVLNRSGTLLDEAKHALSFDLGLENEMHQVLLPLEQRIEIMSLLLTRYMTEQEVNKELRKLPPEIAPGADEFLSEYHQQLKSMQLVQLTSKH